MNPQPIIKHDRVRLDGQAAALPARGTTRNGGSKQVELLRVDGVVRAIQVTCACGEMTVIELDYAQETKGGT